MYTYQYKVTDLINLDTLITFIDVDGNVAFELKSSHYDYNRLKVDELMQIPNNKFTKVDNGIKVNLMTMYCPYKSLFMCGSTLLGEIDCFHSYTVGYEKNTLYPNERTKKYIDSEFIFIKVHCNDGEYSGNVRYTREIFHPPEHLTLQKIESFGKTKYVPTVNMGKYLVKFDRHKTTVLISGMDIPSDIIHNTLYHILKIFHINLDEKIFPIKDNHNCMFHLFVNNIMSDHNELIIDAESDMPTITFVTDDGYVSSSFTPIFTSTLL